MNQFTKGPYALRPSGLIATTEGNIRFLADLRPHHPDGNSLTEEDTATGQLFAAAPALYEAVTLARDVLASIDTVATDGMQAKLSAALALATEGQASNSDEG